MGRVAPSIDEIFFAALEASGPEARAAYLAEVCGPDAELRRRVERMLAASPLVSNFLEPPAAAATVTAEPPLREFAGVVTGPYKLLEPIGEGGMGAVFMAEQTHPVRRKVALKLVKPGMDSKQVLARFEAERQALAMMDHPNIAKVLDAGTTDGGRPYFVMELVRGVPITEYCDREQLSIPERLELFVLVCRAVQHAHQKGIIHRDLKPSNVLVTLHDGVAVPKVIDFGIAKATGGTLTERTLFTGFAQLVGTPLYMSPEQAELSGLDIDTRSDIYSLGVLLYELLTGTTPFDSEALRKAAFDEMRRIIREEEPPKPSTRLSSLGRTLTTVSARRKSDPRRLGRALRGELDWVVMKALEKDRRRRYETASDFAADVLHYLTDRPVAACPPSAWYRFAKYARRNRATLTTAVLIGLALITGTAVSVWQAVRATRAERRSEARYGLARRAVDEVYTQYSEEVLADQPGMTGAQRTFLEKALAYYQEFAAEGGAEPRVRAEAAMATLRVGQIRESLGQDREAQASFRSAVEQTRELVRLYASEPEYRHDLALAHRALGNLFLKIGRMKEAEEEQRQAVDAWTELTTEAPEVTKYRSNLAYGYEYLGDVLEATGRASEAEAAQRAALGMWEVLVRDFPDVAHYRRGLAGSRSTLGRLLNVLGRRQEAEELLRASLELLASLEKESGDRTWHRMMKADALFQLGVVLKKGQPADAEKIWRELVPALESLVADFPDVPKYRWYLAGSLGNVADVVKTLGRVQESEELTRKALVISEDLVKRYPDVPNYRDHLAEAVGDLIRSLQARGELPEVRLQLQRIVALYRTNAGVNSRHPRTLDNLKLATHELMGVLTILNDHTAAAKEAEEYLRLGTYERFHGQRGDLAGCAALTLIRCATVAERDDHLPAERRRATARDYLVRARAVIQETARPEEADRRVLVRLADFLTFFPEPEMRDPELALRLARKAFEGDPRDAGARQSLGWALYRAGDWRGSLETLKQDPTYSRDGDYIAAMASWQLGDKEEARRIFERFDALLPRYERDYRLSERRGEGHTHLDPLLFRLARAEAVALLGVDAKPIGPDAAAVSK